MPDKIEELIEAVENFDACYGHLLNSRGSEAIEDIVQMARRLAKDDPAQAKIAVTARAFSGPAQISAGHYTYPANPTFANYPKSTVDKQWRVWGPESRIVEGYPCEVYHHKESEIKVVEIIEIVAERQVLRKNGERVRYVMATFDSVAEEVGDADNNSQAEAQPGA